MRNADLVARDLKSVWHPCTQMKDHETLPLIPIKRGEGVWLEDFESNRVAKARGSRISKDAATWMRSAPGG